MPARRFIPAHLRTARGGAGLTQAQLAAQLSGRKVGRETVASWESDKTDDSPPADRLPDIARVVGQPVDRLFPRDGDPDLADLRSDAGYNQSEAGKLSGAGRGPLGSAERGKRRLKETHVQPLADLYRVSVEELLAAQERSFGNVVPSTDDVAASPPESLGEKISYLLKNTFQRPPSDDEVANFVNVKAGRHVVTGDDIFALRKDAESSVDPEDPALLDGLADLFSVSRKFFQTNERVVSEVVEGIRYLASIQKGEILGLAARGEEDALTAELLSTINALVADVRQGKVPGSGSGDDRA